MILFESIGQYAFTSVRARVCTYTLWRACEYSFCLVSSTTILEYLRWGCKTSFNFDYGLFVVWQEIWKACRSETLKSITAGLAPGQDDKLLETRSPLDFARSSSP